MFVEKCRLIFGCNLELSLFWNTEDRTLFYNAYIQPHFNYCNIIWGNSSNCNVSKITKLQSHVCKFIQENEYIDLESARIKLNILSFDQAVLLNKAKIMYEVVNGMT